MLDEQHFVELITGQIVRQGRNTFSDDHSRKAAFGLLSDLLRRHQRLEAGFVPLSFALLGNEQNFHGLDGLRASWRSFSISLAAISLDDPVMNSVFLVFCGT